jgi:hypothetical protein
VERINQFAFFSLGETLQPLKGYGTESDLDPNTVFFPTFFAHTTMQRLVGGDPVELAVSKASAIRLRTELWSFIAKYFRQTDDEGKEAWKFPAAGAEHIPQYEWNGVKGALSDFETIFREEMREAAIYRVPRRGIFDTAKLIDAADEAFPAEIAMVIPEKSRTDWEAAGRCLAFNLLSASGFHVARAVEGMLETYYQAAHDLKADSKKATLKSWNDYIVALESAQKADPAKSKMVPTDKVVAELKQMKDDYRNPLTHPRIVLSEPEARILFANGESLIMAMAQEIKAAMPKPSGLSALAGMAGLSANLLLGDQSG